MNNLFQLEGEYWTIAYDDSVVRLRDRRGLQILARLLAYPGLAIPAGELTRVAESQASVPSTTDADARERARVTVTKSIKSALRTIRALHGPLGDHLEVTIRCGYRCTY